MQQDDGVLAERQKANAVSILQSVNHIDAIRMRSALFVDDIQSQEESFAAERLEEQKLKKQFSRVTIRITPLMNKE